MARKPPDNRSGGGVVEAEAKEGDPLFATTMPPPRRAAPVGQKRVPALTILGHPDLGRVGEVCLLEELVSRRELLLSRTAPLFTAPGGGMKRPLADPCLSGKVPIVISIEKDQVAIELPPSLDARVEGERASRTALSTEDLDDGVVIELADRVVLLLHQVQAHRARSGSEHPALARIIGNSDQIEEVRQRILQIADLHHPVLIRGGTGTGKELVAESIARHGERRRQPFVAINMGAIAPGVAAAALFGNTANAWNGAVAQPGFFAKADGGTLFMDEVGLTPHDVQSMLLRALDSGEIQPVGDTRIKNVKVRFIAATDANLEASISAGRFMEPLLHRLAKYELYLPGLAQRRDDIGRLLVHFLRINLEAQGEGDRMEPRGGSEPTYLPARLIAAMARYDWPGNVRELQNVVQQIVASSRGHRHAVMSEALLRRFEGGVPAAAMVDEVEKQDRKPPRPREPASYSEEEILAAADRNRWNVSRMAEELRMSRTTLYKILEKFGLRTISATSDEEVLRLYHECGQDPELTARRLHITSLRGLKLRLAQISRGPQTTR